MQLRGDGFDGRRLAHAQERRQCQLNQQLVIFGGERFFRRRQQRRKLFGNASDAIVAERRRRQLTRSDLAERLGAAGAHHDRRLDRRVEVLHEVAGGVLAFDLAEREGGQGAQLRVAVLGVAVGVEHIDQRAEGARIADARQRQQRPAARAAMRRL